MIRNYLEYKEKLYEYTAHLHSWGIRDPEHLDIGDYTAVIELLLKRFVFITYLYGELLEWAGRPQPFLVSENQSETLPPPRGIASPVKPRELRDLEDEIEHIFDIDFEEMTSTVWPGSEPDWPNQRGAAWVDEARARLAEHLRAEHLDICDLMANDEVLVPCEALNKSQQE